MTFPLFWTRTEEIQKLLHAIDVLRQVYTLHPVSEQMSLRLRRQSILKSSLYSARIEGNPLTWKDVSIAQMNKPQEQHKQEVANIVRALEYIQNEKDTAITTQLLLQIHQKVLTGISGEAGHLRIEDSAIYNQAGIAVYLSPAPQRIRALLDEWCTYCLNSTDPIPIQAAVSHIWFEKIHPFLDGNGRVGRIVTSHMLNRGGYDFGGMVPLEEYLDIHRDEYYHALSIDRSDVSDFVVFYLNAIYKQAELSIQDALMPKQIPFPDLLPRRAEIVSIICDHKLISFDFLARRFRTIPSRTLHYDLKELFKKGYIRKLGTTRGAMYAPGEISS